MIIKTIFCLALLQLAASHKPDDLLAKKDCFECCKYAMESDEYNKCCVKRGCCPNCEKVPFGSLGTYPIQYDCKRAWKCCLLPFLSEEFHQCCMSYGCCPICDGVPKGCCYGSKMQVWGGTVASFPEVCLELRCGASLLKDQPYVLPQIVPFFLPKTECKDPCEHAQNRHCLDAHHIIRDEGDTWYERATCELCLCRDGQVTCNRVRMPCPPPPKPHCRPVGNGCCPNYDCSDVISCPALDTFESNCRLYKKRCRTDKDCKEDEHCCSVGRCGKVCQKLCVDESGIRHAIGETWISATNSCVVVTCLEGGATSETHIQCPICLLQISTSCKWVHPTTDCCGHWECPERVAQLGDVHPRCEPTISTNITVGKEEILISKNRDS
ncbi:kielin/chordin-like protein [Penaeus chinensis]|uniref:kielin/chordin-like protein n=1 Tax=Penaeus chinensis TaxID=139456 RepID=UPI001FB85D04|nr:kielin/chordin-like protein [Penaeus chinensis]